MHRALLDSVHSAHSLAGGLNSANRTAKSGQLVRLSVAGRANGAAEDLK